MSDAVVEAIVAVVGLAANVVLFRRGCQQLEESGRRTLAQLNTDHATNMAELDELHRKNVRELRDIAEGRPAEKEAKPC